MKFAAKNDTEKRLLDWLEANASEALREKIAALPEGAPVNLSAAWDYIQAEARKLLKSKSGMVDDDVVWGWLCHYYEDVAAGAAEKAAKDKAEAAARKAADKERAAKARAEAEAKVEAKAEAKAAKAAEKKDTSGVSLILFEADEEGAK